MRTATEYKDSCNRLNWGAFNHVYSMKGLATTAYGYTDSTTLLLTNYLPIKICFCARQQSTNIGVYLQLPHIIHGKRLIDARLRQNSMGLHGPHAVLYGPCNYYVVYY